MAETQPRGEQLRFLSSKTGTHNLDTYLEAAERGTRSIGDMLGDIFDSSGVFDATNFEFQFDSSDSQLEVRVGGSSGSWLNITNFFNLRGTWSSSSTTYKNFDLVTRSNGDVYIVKGLASNATTTTFANDAAVDSSSNTVKFVDVSGAATQATAAASSATAAASSASTASTQASNASTSASTATTQASNASTSASTASTQATNAATSATAAATSATAAAASATTASTQATAATTAKTAAETAETNAETAETNAETAETNAETAETNAATSATTATTQASNASTSATTATTQASNASTSATTASTQASNASTSATAAASSATSAASSATSAASAQTAAEAALDSFDDKYLGAKGSAPTLDNDGNALTDGALYYLTTTNVMYAYDLGTTTWLALKPSSSEQTNINSAVSNATNINTVATNIAGVNSFADRYRIASSDPVSSLDEGDLVYNSTSNTLKFYDGSSWNTIAADTDVKAGVSSGDSTPDYLLDKFAAGTNITLTKINTGGDEQIQIAATEQDPEATALAIALG